VTVSGLRQCRTVTEYRKQWHPDFVHYLTGLGGVDSSCRSVLFSGPTLQEGIIMRRIAVINQKGGVGKTTTTVNLAAALARAGNNVGVIDLDPQAHASAHLGMEPDGSRPSMYNALVENVPLAQVRQQMGERLWLMGADINLAAAEMELSGVVGREVILRDLLEQDLAPLSRTGIRDGESRLRLMELNGRRVIMPRSFMMGFASIEEPLTPNRSPRGGERNRKAFASSPSKGEGSQVFDYLLMDCGPSLGVLTLNALACADEVFIPLQPHYLALHGLGKLLETTSLVAKRINPSLTVSGIVICLYESTTKLSGEVIRDLESFLQKSRGTDLPWSKAEIFTTRIRRNIKLAECPSFGKSIFEYAPSSNGAEDYAALADEVQAQYRVTAQRIALSDRMTGAAKTFTKPARSMVSSK
jgi:chromosome partitioning protein